MDKVVFDLIIQVLIPEMDDVKSRKALVSSALHGSPVLYRIEWDGSALDFTKRLVRVLDEYGEANPGQPALVTVLEEAKRQVGNDRQRQIDYLIGLTHDLPTNQYVTDLQHEDFSSSASQEWRNNIRHVYIAYAREDGQVHAAKIHNELLSEGIPAW